MIAVWKWRAFGCKITFNEEEEEEEWNLNEAGLSEEQWIRYRERENVPVLKFTTLWTFVFLKKKDQLHSNDI